MATLPDSTALGGLATASGERQVASVDTSPIGAGVARLGQGVEQLANGVGTYARTLGAQSDAVDEAKAASAYTVGRVNLDDETKSLTDPDEIKAQAAKYNANLESAAQLIANPQAREMFKLRYAPDTARGLVMVSDHADTQDKDVELSTFHSSANTMIDNAPKVDDPTRAANLDTINTSIDKLVENGRITRDQAVEWKRAYSQKYLTTSFGAVQDPNDRLNLIRAAPQTKDGVLNRIGGVEDASGDPTAKNPNSSATGQFQFIDSTWLGLVRSYRPDLAGKPEAELLALRADGKMQREMAGHYYDEIAGYFQSHGVEPSATNMRLGWFLGQGDAAKVIKADPNTPIADLVNGNSIVANPTILPGRTAGTVVAWANKQMGGTGAGGSIYTKLLPATTLVDLRAQSARAAQLADDKASQDNRDEIATVQKLVKDDQASLVTSGKPLDTLTPERVGLALGSQAQEDFLASRQLAQGYHDATHQWDTLPEAAILQKAESLKPAPGAANFTQAQKYYEAAQTAAETIIKARYDDPAGSVDTLPETRQARQAVDPAKPESYQPVIAARMQAQARIGIPEGARSPISEAEAKGYAATLRPLAQGEATAIDQTQKINQVVQDIAGKYGPYAKDALSRVLYHVTMKRDASDILASAVDQFINSSGPIIPGANDAHRVQVERDAARAAATAGFGSYGPQLPTVEQQFPPGSPGSVAFDPASGMGGTPVQPPLRPLSQALDLLRSDPQRYLPDFLANPRFGPDAVPADLVHLLPPEIAAHRRGAVMPGNP